MEKTIYFGCFKLLKGINLLTKTRKMKRKLLLALSAALLTTGLMAGGIMTNTNQSAAYARLLARNASLGIDAVYYNPAGLTKLKNGFHLSLNNQSIFQTKDVVNNYKYLHGSPDATYTGIVTAPVFPGIYAVYKIEKLAFSFGFNPVGGGGGAQYDTGLPSFEIPISDLVPILAPKSSSDPDFKVSDYKTDINFEGTSIYFGYQFGLSYEINPAISLFAGIRTVTAKNTYKGSIVDIMINPNYTASPAIPNVTTPTFGGGFIRADEFAKKMKDYYSAGSPYLAGVATYYTGVATQYNGAAAAAGNLTAAGLGSYTYAQAQAAGAITAAQQAQFEAALTAVNQPVTTPIATSQVVYTTTASQATAGSAQAAAGSAKMASGATQMAALEAGTGNKEVDVTQTGTGYTPIFGANLTLAEKLTIAIKYEMKTKIELTNKTTTDGTGMFPDGAKSRADMPAMLSIGASYPVGQKLRASLGYNYYWDKNADYGRKNASGVLVPNDAVIDKNYFELGLGLEYNITEKFLLSAGYLTSQTGVSKDYQTDLSYSLSSNTGAFGGQYQISPAVGINLGGLMTFYKNDDKTYNHTLGTTSIPVTETYSKTNWLLAIGLDITIGK
jgi:long-chain fatty acid transport protein